MIFDVRQRGNGKSGIKIESEKSIHIGDSLVVEWIRYEPLTDEVVITVNLPFEIIEKNDKNIWIERE